MNDAKIFKGLIHSIEYYREIESIIERHGALHIKPEKAFKINVKWVKSRLN